MGHESEVELLCKTQLKAYDVSPLSYLVSPDNQEVCIVNQWEHLTARFDAKASKRIANVSCGGPGQYE